MTIDWLPLSGPAITTIGWRDDGGPGSCFRAAKAWHGSAQAAPAHRNWLTRGGGPDLIGGRGADCEIGAVALWKERHLSTTYGNAKKKNIYFWLTAGLIARTCLESLAITNLIQPFTYGASAPLLRATRPCVE